MGKLVDQGEKYGLTINSFKTKIIGEPSRCNIKIRGEGLKPVASIIFLGAALDESCTSRKEKNMKEYVRIMKKCVENIEEYMGNMKKFVGNNMKK